MMDFTMIFSRSSFIQVFGGVAPPPHVKPPQNLVKSGAKLAFPRWNSVIMNQIGKHNGKLKRKLYHFSNSSQKKISQNFSPSIFCGAKNALLLRSSWDFSRTFLGRNMVADFRDDVVSTKVAVLRPDLALHSGPLGRLVAMLRDQEWKGLEGGWARLGKDAFSPRFPTWGSPGSNGGRDAPEFGGSPWHFFSGFLCFESGRV